MSRDECIIYKNALSVEVAAVYHSMITVPTCGSENITSPLFATCACIHCTLLCEARISVCFQPPRQPTYSNYTTTRCVCIHVHTCMLLLLPADLRLPPPPPPPAIDDDVLILRRPSFASFASSALPLLPTTPTASIPQSMLPSSIRHAAANMSKVRGHVMCPCCLAGPILVARANFGHCFWAWCGDDELD